MAEEKQTKCKTEAELRQAIADVETWRFYQTNQDAAMAMAAVVDALRFALGEASKVEEIISAYAPKIAAARRVKLLIEGAAEIVTRVPPASAEELAAFLVDMRARAGLSLEIVPVSDTSFQGWQDGKCYTWSLRGGRWTAEEA